MFNFGDEKVVLKHKGKEYTAGELKELALARAGLLAQNICPNLLLCSDDNFEFIIDFWAGIFAKKEIFLLTDKKKKDLLQGDFIMEAAGNGHALELPSIDVPALDWPASELLAIEPEKVFINFYTSGTTSEPKKVRKSLQNLIDEALDLYAKFPVDEDAVFVTTTKLTHMFGMTFAFMYPFVNGFVINTDVIKFPEQIKDEKFAFISTPSFLDKMAKYNINPMPPAYIFTAGDKLKNSTFEFFENQSKVVEIYGSTESGVIASRTSSKETYLTPLPNVRVSAGSDNQICVKSNYFMEDFLILNDVIEKKDEKFRILSRSDRVLKIQEKRISALELEEILNKSQYVDNSYCFKYGEKIAAVIVLSETGKKLLLETSTAEMIKALKKHVKQYSELYPQKWRFLHEIPKTETGKINKAVIDKIFGINLSMPLVFDKKINSNKVEITLAFLKNSNFFNGHFPEIPILPGVVQLFFAHFFAENEFCTDISVHKIKKIKFSKIIKPDTKIILNLSDNDLSVDYSYTDGENIFSSGTFIK